MSSLIKIKRSAVPGKIPTTENIEVGELAINTFDGNLFTKLNQDGNEFVYRLNSKAQIQKYEFVAAENQSSFTIEEGYISGTLTVYQNGILLLSNQYNDLTGSTVQILSEIQEGDDIIVLVPSYYSSNVIHLKHSTIVSTSQSLESDSKTLIASCSSDKYNSGEFFITITQGNNIYSSKLSFSLINETILYNEYSILTNDESIIDELEISYSSVEKNIQLNLTMNSNSLAKIAIHQTLNKKIT
jgi:hypothetical protein